VAPDAGNGLFIANNAVDLAQPQASIRHVTSDGSVAWTTTWAPLPPEHGHIRFAGAARTPNDGVIVAGVLWVNVE